jgi:cell division septation protein DedD
VTYQFGPVDPEERAQYSGMPEPARRRTLAATALAIGLMAIFAGALWLAYQARSHHAGPGAVPLIRADRTPAKVKPTSPDGMHISDQNMLIYNESEPKVERLLPPPEQPLPRPAPPPAPVAAPPASAAQSGAQTPTTPAAPAPTSVPAVPAKSTAAAAAPPAGKEIRVQLGALRSADLAEREWQRLKHANGDILGKLPASPVRADLGEKGIFYRIEVGPLASPEAAAQLCGELKKRDVGCMLVR